MSTLLIACEPRARPSLWCRAPSSVRFSCGGSPPDAPQPIALASGPSHPVPRYLRIRCCPGQSKPHGRCRSSWTPAFPPAAKGRGALAVPLSLGHPGTVQNRRERPNLDVLCRLPHRGGGACPTRRSAASGSRADLTRRSRGDPAAGRGAHLTGGGSAVPADLWPSTGSFRSSRLRALSLVPSSCRSRGVPGLLRGLSLFAPVTLLRRTQSCHAGAPAPTGR